MAGSATPAHTLLFTPSFPPLPSLQSEERTLWQVPESEERTLWQVPESEERTLWQVPEVYMTMSPFLAADRIKSPILLVHGQDDNNTGTFPMQTERFFAALKGHGVTTRMVLLPHEGHGYRARESLLHVLAEQSNWLDRYCKNRPAPPPGDKANEAGVSAAAKTNEPVGAAVEGAKEENGHEHDGSWLRASL
ncbi:unnamed protein product [Closterium sp. NIES-64]|nr:unnamed protein product [Closterium sp. NIES-64]